VTDLPKTISTLSSSVSKSGPGTLAALRRGPLEDQGVAAFWKLVAPLDLNPVKENDWAAIVQCIAILVPKGDIRVDPHQPQTGMGTMLYSAHISELRLTALLSAPREERRTLLPRICRRLASQAEYSQFNLTDLAYLVISNKQEFAWKVAKDYYREQAADQKRKEQTKADEAADQAKSNT